jgi:hypothetical protein
VHVPPTHSTLHEQASSRKYGQLLHAKKQNARNKGWFPRRMSSLTDGAGKSTTGFPGKHKQKFNFSNIAGSIPL